MDLRDGVSDDEASSNLPGTVEAQLRPVVLGKLRNGSLLPHYGAFFKEDLSDPDSLANGNQFGLYLLNLGAAEKENVRIVLALIHEEADLLETFHAEAERFLLSLHLSAPDKPLTVLESERLSGWRVEVVDGLGIALEALGPALPALLTALYKGYRPLYTQPQSPLASKIATFIALVAPSSTQESGDKREVTLELESALGNAADTFTVDINDGKATISYHHSTSFTREWAQVVGKLICAGPLALHQINRAFKEKAMGDMNRLRRLLIAARVDHYALYRTVEFVRETQNEEILLDWAQREAVAAADEDSIALLHTIQKHISLYPPPTQTS